MEQIFVLEKNFWAERAKKILILSCLNEKVGGELTSITRWRCLLLIPISYIVVFVERDRRDNSGLSLFCRRNIANDDDYIKLIMIRYHLRG